VRAAIVVCVWIVSKMKSRTKKNVPAKKTARVVDFVTSGPLRGLPRGSQGVVRRRQEGADTGRSCYADRVIGEDG
jgi:hypothetical protein